MPIMIEIICAATAAGVVVLLLLVLVLVVAGAGAAAAVVVLGSEYVVKILFEIFYFCQYVNKCNANNDQDNLCCCCCCCTEHVVKILSENSSAKCKTLNTNNY